ncbi:unnamed protein product [Linum tenue]|uniref:Uncharacterized protein n=1 Tax=Linum tenue TaxID=586396 RepID=A0AAV0QQ12_9ROSI|nr:unnamed protein product [Linum tenue]
MSQSTTPIRVSLSKLLSILMPAEATKEDPPPPSEDLCPTRSRNRRSPRSETSAYTTPFMWPFPITPTTFLPPFTALLRFRDQAREFQALSSCNSTKDQQDRTETHQGRTGFH